MKTVVIDGATLFSAAAIFERMRESRSIRPINILSLCSLLDSYVSFDGALADTKGWNRFVELAPPEWSSALNEFIKPIDMDLSKYTGSLERFLNSETTFSILNAQIFLETTSSVRSDFMTYVGRDFGVTAEDANEAQLIGNLINKNIERWEYHAASQEHIDSIQAMWRGVNYLDFCAAHGHAFIPHELRARFQKSLAILEGYEADSGYVNKVLTQLRNEVRKRESQPRALSPFDRRSIEMWEDIGWPLLSARVLQEARNIYDLFDKASILQEEMKGFRKFCHELDVHDNPADFRAKIKKLVDFFHELPVAERKFERSMSIAISISPSLDTSLQIDFSNPLSAPNEKKCLSFMRDIYENLTLPYSLKDDVARIFGIVLWENASQRTSH